MILGVHELEEAVAHANVNSVWPQVFLPQESQTYEKCWDGLEMGSSTGTSPQLERLLAFRSEG